MKKLLLIAICFLSLQLQSFHSLAQPIIGTTWSGSGFSSSVATDPSTFTTLPATVMPGATAVNVSQWNRNNLQATATTATACYNTNDWELGGSLASAQASAKYIYFTITNDGNTELEVTQVFISSQVSGTGPQTVQMQYAIGAGPDQNFGSSSVTGATGSGGPYTVDFTFTGIAHLCAGQTATFKLYGWGGTGAAGTLRVNDNSSLTATYVQPPVSATASNSTIFFPNCSGDPLDLSSTPFGGALPYSYSWVGPAGFTSTDANPSIPSADWAGYAGTYSLTVTDAYGCISAPPATTFVDINVPADTTTTISGPLSFCTPGSVTLSVPDDGFSSYTWYDAFFSTMSTTASFTTSTSGTYHVEIFDAFTFCTTIGTSYTVTVTTTPVPTVTASGPTTICSPSTVTLTTPTVAGYTYQWYDAAGVIAGATNASYNVSASGVYHVTVVNGTCSASSTNTTVTINTPPAVPVVTPAGPITVCSGTTTTLTTSTQSGVTYRWWRSGFPLPGATGTTYGATTTGTYTMVVTNTANTCFATSNTVSLTVNPSPSASFSSSSTVVCSGNNVTLTAGVAPGIAYQWLLGNVPIVGATNNQYVTNVPGTYRLLETRTATGCFDTSAAPGTTITTATAPTVASATISPAGPFTICSFDSVVLSVPVTAGVTYQWYNPGSIPGATSRTYTARTSGTYTIRVTNAATCVTNSPNTVTITVNPAPPSTVTTSGPTAFCTGGSVNITAAIGGGYTYQWYDAAGAIAGETASTYTATTSGTYHAVVTSAAGCATTTASTTVTVVATPTILTTGATSFCTGNSLLLTASTSAIPGVIYQWKRNGTNIAGAVSATYVANVTGLYTCFVNIPGSCAVLTAPVTVTVFPAIIPVLSYDGTYVSTYTTYASYQWYANTVMIPGATSYRVAAFTNAAYRVKVTDVNGCILLSSDLPVYNLAVENVNGENAISIYPNPATSTVHVASTVEVNVSISTLEGKSVMTGTNKNDMDISSLPNGLYMITVFDSRGNRVHVEKLVKQ